MSFLVLYSIISLVNVILSTTRQLLTIKGGKLTAALSMAIYCGFNTIVVVYTAIGELPLWQKVVVTVVTNLVGVFAVKFVEDAIRQVKLWKFEATISNSRLASCISELKSAGIPHSYIPNVGHHALVYCYCGTKEESRKVVAIFERYKAKYFATESRLQ